MSNADTPPEYEAKSKDAPPDAEPTLTSASTSISKTKPTFLALAQQKPGKTTGEYSMTLSKRQKDVTRRVNDVVIVEADSTFGQYKRLVDSRVKAHFNLDLVNMNERRFGLYEMIVDEQTIKLTDEAGWQVAKRFLEDGREGERPKLEFRFAIGVQDRKKCVVQ